MIFSSLVFIFAFLPLSLIIFHLTPKKAKKYTLLALSGIFCISHGVGFFAFAAAYTLLNYIAGIICGAFQKRRSISGAAAAVSIAADIFILLLFRRDIFPEISAASSIMQLIIPVGISFMTLTAIGYILDIITGEISAEKNFISFSLYMLFFPKLPMGPIVSYRSFIRSLKHPSAGLDELGRGLSVFVKGLAKKVILADNVYMLFSAVRNTPADELTSLSALLGVISFFFSMYFTLSGMSDMGAGLARCFGIRLPQSFRHPAASIGMYNFSQKWHTPVVSWFRKYVTGSVFAVTNNKLLRCAAIISAAVMLGLWYRFSLNMLLCGIAVGTVLACEKVFPTAKMIKTTRMMYTYFMLCFGMVFFFSDSIVYTLRYFTGILSINSGIADASSVYLFKTYAFVLLLSLIAAGGIHERIFNRIRKKRFSSLLELIFPLLTAGLLILCTVEMSYSGSSEMTLPILKEVIRC